MDLIQIITSNVPAGPLQIVAFLFIGFFYAWPQIREFFRKTRGRSLKIEGARQTLEMLKLKYEIEALRKEHDLEDLATDAEKKLLSAYIKQREQDEAEIEKLDAPPKTKEKLPLKRQFIYTSLGSLLASVWILWFPIAYFSGDTTYFSDAMEVFLTILAFLVLNALVGFVAAILPGATRRRCFLSGLFLMVLVLSGLAYMAVGS